MQSTLKKIIMKTKKTTQLVLGLLSIFTFFSIQAQDEDVMFQAFDWNVQNQPAGQTWYDVVSSSFTRNEINNAGIDVIWMPPPSNSAAPQGYLPRELYDFNSAYGTETQLRSLISQYHALDIKVLSDIVINHRVGSLDAVNFENPDWPTFFITADDEGNQFVNPSVPFSINADFFPGNALKSDGSNGGFAAARDLDHENPAVRAEIITWMNFLKNDIGFDGWRYDFVHGYNPIYNKEYNDATNPYFAVGELLESSRVQINNFVNATQQSSSAFDFNTKVSLQNALRDNNLSYLRDFNGNPSGLIGINPSKSVTFLDNHDTGLSQVCCGTNYVFPQGENNLRKGYAYILTHPGNPMVFWTHFFDDTIGVRNAIKDLIAARKSVRVHSASSINIVAAQNDLYAAYIDGKSGTLAMKLGSGNWSPPANSGWVLQTSGVDYAVWTQGAESPVTTPPFTVNFSKPNNWGNTINVYFYDTATNSTIATTQGWPGQSMTNISNTPWYSYTLTPPDGVNAANIRVIFNDGSQQTDDLTRSTTGWYLNGTWSDNCPVNCSNNQSNTVTYQFKIPDNNWSNNTNVYLYNKSSNTTLSGTPGWPGTSMNNIAGTPWLRQTFTIPNGVSTNQIGLVFNDGNGTQTIDLSRGVDGWFTITGNSNGMRTGVWNDNCPSECSNLNKTSTLTTNFNAKQSLDVTVTPNPIREDAILSLETINNGLLEVKVSNILGQTKTIYSNNTKAGIQQINVNGEHLGKAGIYFLDIRLNGEKLKQIKVIRN